MDHIDITDAAVHPAAYSLQPVRHGTRCGRESREDV